MSPRNLFLTVVTLACVAGSSVALTSQAVASDVHPASRCGTFHAKGAEYGVYIADGHVPCGAATVILRAVAGGKGKIVNNGASANSYVLYGGWLCPFGNMGEQTCEHSSHPVNNPTQEIASLSCSFGGCPERAKFPNG
jgi:hypothetical protein